MHFGFLYHIQKSVRVWIVPSYKSEVGALCIAEGILSKARVRDEPALISSRSAIGRIRQVLISCVDVKRVLDIGLAGRIVVEFCFDADATSIFFREYVDFVRSAPACQHNSCSRRPAVCAQNFCKKLLERKTGRPKLEYSTLHGIASCYRCFLFRSEDFKSVFIYIFSRHSRFELTHNMFYYPISNRGRRPGISPWFCKV